MASKRSLDEKHDESSTRKRSRQISGEETQLNDPLKRIIEIELQHQHELNELAEVLRTEFLRAVLQKGIKKAKEDNRQMVNGDDLWWALDSLGFKSYADQLISKGIAKVGDAKSAGKETHPTGDPNLDLPEEPFKKIMEQALQHEISAGISMGIREMAVKCTIEFIRLVLLEARKKSSQDNRQNLNSDDLLWGMETLGFKNFADQFKSKLVRISKAEGSASATNDGLGQPGSSSQPTEETLVQKPGTD